MFRSLKTQKTLLVLFFIEEIYYIVQFLPNFLCISLKAQIASLAVGNNILTYLIIHLISSWINMSWDKLIWKSRIILTYGNYLIKNIII